MIDREDVIHIARLARLKLTGEEVELFSRQLGSILEYVKQLESAPTGGVDPMSVIVECHDSMRDDEPLPTMKRDEILQNGPLIREDYFAFPKVIGG